MFGTTKTPARSALLPTQALRLFNFYMEGTRTMNDDKGILTELCLDAGSVLARIQQPARKALASLSSASSASNGDMALRQGIALAYHELARLFEHLGYSGEVHRYDRKAEKWGYIQGSSNNNSDNSGSGNNTNSSEEESTRTSGSRTEAVPAQFIATISKDIFNHDEPPTMVRHSLPEPGAHLNNIHQLTYCLSLLPTIPVLPNDLNENERKWRQALSNDQDECKRLHKLAWDVIGLFASDEIKTEATIAEVVSLAPALDQDQFRTLLMALVNGIGRNMILKPHLLEGLAQLIQHAPPGYLDSDDLVLTLNTLSSRLRGTHTQSDDHLCRLSAAVSDVLDAMVSNQVKGLKREQLHEPLAIYLKELKANSDPYLVYQAAYAFQALQYVPDNESTVQAMLRRTSAVLRGVFGALGAVKSLDLKVFMDEISNIQKELPSVTGAIDMSLKVYTGATSLYEGGTTFRQCMEEGLSFSHKSAWYPALRGADALLQRGEFTKFKTLVCEAPCRNEAAFQWGLCQRLGWIAADTRWTINTRQDAITFLGEIYKNDQEWSDHEHVKQWIIHILSRLSSLSPDFLQAIAALLNDLKTDGDVKKRELYKKCLQESMIQHSFISTLTPSTASHLLGRAQKRPDVEDSLRQLKKHRIEVGNDQEFYIPQYAKASPQAKDDKLFLLMNKVKQFLNSNQKVLLVQGDSGVGKSTFNRTLERTLWDAYQKGDGRIPLFINLPAIDKPEKQLVAKQLRDYGFTDPQIKELKTNRSFILICDGYDESMQTNNLYVANRLNQPGEWKVQMVISCRSEYLGLDYRDRFQPMNRNHQADVGLLEEAVIMPFSETQIDDYIEQYVDTMDPMWHAEDYRRALKIVPGLHDLVKNPFMLSMSLQVLPRMVDPNQDISNTKIKRVILYDQFVEQWLERGKKRLGETLRPEDKRMFHKLLDEGFAHNGIKYLTELAAAIYKHQDGNPVVEYSSYKDKNTWKERCFSNENGRNLLRDASPLNRTGNQHRFIHKSILEYSLVRAIFEPQLAMSASAKDGEGKATASTSRRQSVSSMYSFEGMKISEDEQEVDPAKVDERSPLVWRSFVDEPSILQFLEDRVCLEPAFKQQLYTYVELSKSDSKWRIAAANAMTILVRAGEPFIGTDLRGIQIPGADLSRGIFEYAQLQGADLRRVNLRKCWLREADLSGAKMAGVQFGEWPLMEIGGKILAGAASSDGKTVAAGIINAPDEPYKYSIAMYDISTRKKLLALGTDATVYVLLYSPDSRYIAFWHTAEKKVSVWDTISGGLISLDHTERTGRVVYSPSGDHLAVGSESSVWVWNTQSGLLKYTLEGHTDTVESVAYSPDGLHIATGSRDKTFRLWDAISGQQLMVMDHESAVLEILYSPNGQQFIVHNAKSYRLQVWDVASLQKKLDLKHESFIAGTQYSPKGRFASISNQKVYQWDMQTGKPLHILEGPSDQITRLKYSPNEEQIVACVSDYTIWIWNTISGQLINILYGHSRVITYLTYSPDSQQIVSLSLDKTIRFWDTRPQQSNHGSHGHLAMIRNIRASPDGRQIASITEDATVRLWDVRTGYSTHTLQSSNMIRGEIMYSPDGQLLASSYKSGAYLWNVQTGQIAHTLELQDNGLWWFDFSPIGHQIASVHESGEINIWDTQTGTLSYTLQSNGVFPLYAEFSPDGCQLASCSAEDDTLRVWTVHSWNLQYAVKLEVESYFFEYTPDSRKIVIYPCQFDMCLQVLNAETGERCYIAQSEGCRGRAAFSPCSRWMAFGPSDKILVIDLESGAVLHRLEGNTYKIVAISYSPDGRYFASSSSNGSVQVWDSETGQRLVEILSEDGIVKAFVWNIFEGGYFLVTGCADGLIRMWQIVQENNQYQYYLKWSTKQTTLNARNTVIQDVVGLDEVNRELLKQRGAIDEQSLSLVTQETSQYIEATPPMTSNSKAFSSQVDYHQDPVETDSEEVILREGISLTPPTGPSRSIKDYKFKYSLCSKCNFAHVISCRPHG